MNIGDSKNLLLVIGSGLNYVSYLNLVAIIEILQKRGISVDIYMPQALPANFTQSVPLPEVKKIDKLAPRKFILTFPQNSQPIKNLQWNQSDDKITFHIYMSQGNFIADGMQFKSEGAEYDTIMFYQVDDFAAVSSLFQDSANIWQEVKTFSIGTSVNPSGASVETITSTGKQLFTEKMYESFKGLGMSKEHYTLFLAGILAETNRFSSTATSAETFILSAELIGHGAALDYANKLADGQTTQPKTVETAPAAEPETTSSESTAE